MIEGTDFFDDDERFGIYMAGRHRPDSPNETLEKPVFVELMGDVLDKHILVRLFLYFANLFSQR